MKFEINKETAFLKLGKAVQCLEDGKAYIVEIKKKTVKRSLTANAYYWTLVEKMAKGNKISTAYQHNLLLRRYGELEKMDGNLITIQIPEIAENENYADENETIHLKPTSQIKVSKNGTVYRTYLLLKGSHTFDNVQMHRLIEGTRDEAEQMGIEVLTLEEMARLRYE